MPIRYMRLVSLGWIAAGLTVILGCVYLAEGMEKPVLQQPLALWGAFILGAALIAIGVTRWAASPGSAEEAREMIAENDFIVSLRIWLIAAAADGVLDAREIDVIVRNAKACFGRDIDEAFVRKTYEVMKRRTGARHIDDELFSTEILLSAEGVRHTLYGAIYVALFDGDLDHEERRVIDEIASRLELTPELIDRMIAEVSTDIAQHPQTAHA